MACCSQHRTQEDRHIVAVAGPQFQHAPGGMEQLGAQNVACIPDIPANPIEYCEDFPKPILCRNPITPEYVDGFLSDQKILGPFANQLGDHLRRCECTGGSSRDMAEDNPWFWFAFV
jgi:hypothetical protein